MVLSRREVDPDPLLLLPLQKEQVSIHCWVDRTFSWLEQALSCSKHGTFSKLMDIQKILSDHRSCVLYTIYCQHFETNCVLFSDLKECVHLIKQIYLATLSWGALRSISYY